MNNGSGIVVPKVVLGWMLQRDGEHIETIQRFVTRLWDSGITLSGPPCKDGNPSPRPER